MRDYKEVKEIFELCRKTGKNLTPLEKMSIRDEYKKRYKNQKKFNRLNEIRNIKRLENRIRELEEEREEILKILGVDDR